MSVLERSKGLLLTLNEVYAEFQGKIVITILS